jgi:Flp pilus assembly protein TadG
MKLFRSRILASSDRKKRSGTAVAEFACISPLFALVLMGMIELSRGLMVKVILSDAARKGCRSGIQPGKGNADIVSDCTQVMTDNHLKGLQVAITVTDPTGNVLPDTLGATSGSMVSVQISIPVSSTTWVPNVFLAKGSLESDTVVMMKQ